MKEQLKRIWAKKKNEGIIVYASRCSGKTETLLEIVIEESKNNKVVIWTRNEQQKMKIKSLLIKRYGITSFDIIKVLNILSNDDKYVESKHNPVYKFYDEIKIEKSSRTFCIRSLDYDENLYIFNINNPKHLITGERLKELKSQISEDQWHHEFMSGVVEE